MASFSTSIDTETSSPKDMLKGDFISSKPTFSFDVNTINRLLTSHCPPVTSSSTSSPMVVDSTPVLSSAKLEGSASSSSASSPATSPFSSGSGTDLADLLSSLGIQPSNANMQRLEELIRIDPDSIRKMAANSHKQYLEEQYLQSLLSATLPLMSINPFIASLASTQDPSLLFSQMYSASGSLSSAVGSPSSFHSSTPISPISPISPMSPLSMGSTSSPVSNVGSAASSPLAGIDPMLLHTLQMSGTIGNDMGSTIMCSPFMREIEDAVTQYRKSATIVSQNRDAALHWSGQLPSRSYKGELFSRKVFLGGVPWDSSIEDLETSFSIFGNVTVLWPQKENMAIYQHRSPPPKGFCYLIFENDQSVRCLLHNCCRDNTGNDFYKITSSKFRAKDVQVIPWDINDSQYNRPGLQRPEVKHTVFIGALHGMITAEALFNIMTDLFGHVTSVSLDTDKYKYPIGSGRVTFSTSTSYAKAVSANFVEIRTQKFNKTIQIDPYLEDASCAFCRSGGLYFCRAFECFAYFCPTCWFRQHSTSQTLSSHKPLRRTFKRSSVSSTSSIDRF